MIYFLTTKNEYNALSYYSGLISMSKTILISTKQNIKGICIALSPLVHYEINEIGTFITLAPSVVNTRKTRTNLDLCFRYLSFVFN